MVKRNTCVFISGQGSNLKNLIYHSRDNSFPIKISLVISNNKKAAGIIYAKKYRIPYFYINKSYRISEKTVCKKSRPGEYTSVKYLDILPAYKLSTYQS